MVLVGEVDNQGGGGAGAGRAVWRAIPAVPGDHTAVGAGRGTAHLPCGGFMTSGELAVRARVALLFAPVGVRNYRLFWIAAAAWSGAVSMQTLALAVIALDLTGRPSGWAAVLTAQ